MSYHHIDVGGRWDAAAGDAITVVSSHDGSAVGISPGSGIGREYGLEGLQAFTEVKSFHG
jgi:acyl-CoA reductase-like NAD-dependent aldehyde dehydrogenase